MTEQLTDAIWLNESDVCSIEHLADVSGLSLEEVRDLVDSGVIQPASERDAPASFPLHTVVTMITARRLRDDFELDRRGVAVALMLVQRIRELEAELESAGAAP